MEFTFNQIINDKIDWRLKQRDQYLDSYKNHKYCNLVINEIFPIILDKKIKFLSELNIKLISKICKLLEINTQLKKTGGNIVGTQSEERELRKKIERLITKEGVLQKKRAELKEKLILMIILNLMQIFLNINVIKIK